MQKFNALMELAASPEGNLALSEVGRRLIRSPANVSTLIDRLEADGFVRRVEDRRDRRVTLAKITEVGWRVLRPAAQAVFEAERRVLRDLSSAQRRTLTRLLEDVEPPLEPRQYGGRGNRFEEVGSGKAWEVAALCIGRREEGCRRMRDQPRGLAALGTDPIRTIGREELKEALDRKEPVKLVMALNRWAFDAKHIPGSLHFDDPEELYAALRTDDDIVVYCSNVDCLSSVALYRALVERGYENVRRYAGGLIDWEEAGLPMEGNLVSVPPEG